MSTLTHPFNIFLERIMIAALEDHEGIASTGGRTTTNLRFADSDGLARDEEELAKLVERLDKVVTAYGMENSDEKTQADDKQHQWHQHRDQSK